MWGGFLQMLPRRPLDLIPLPAKKVPDHAMTPFLIQCVRDTISQRQDFQPLRNDFFSLSVGSNFWRRVQLTFLWSKQKWTLLPSTHILSLDHPDFPSSSPLPPFLYTDTPLNLTLFTNSWPSPPLWPLFCDLPCLVSMARFTLSQTLGKRTPACVCLCAL